MKSKKTNVMKNFEGRFINNIIENLNLTPNQKKEFENLKKQIKKDKIKFAVKFIFGKNNFEIMFDSLVNKLETAENILDNEQKNKLRQLMIEKHRDFFLHHFLMKKDEIKKLIDSIELSENQRDEVEKIFYKIINEENNISFENFCEYKKQIKSILNENQLEKTKEYFKKHTHLNEIFNKIGINNEQKLKFKEIHNQICSSRKEKFNKFKSGELSLSDIAKEKRIMFGQIKSILTQDQIEQIKNIHKEKCNNHKHFHNHFC